MRITKKKMTETYLILETSEEPGGMVGASKFSIEELIDKFKKFGNHYVKLGGIKDIPIENNGKFWYDDFFVHKYIFQASDSFEIWKPSEQAPLLVDHLKQDLRILIAPEISL